MLLCNDQTLSLHLVIIQNSNIKSHPILENLHLELHSKGMFISISLHLYVNKNRSVFWRSLPENAAWSWLRSCLSNRCCGSSPNTSITPRVPLPLQLRTHPGRPDHPPAALQASASNWGCLTDGLVLRCMCPQLIIER